MNPKIFNTLIVGLAICLIAVSLGGLLIPDMYFREIGDWKAQAVAQDFFDLVFALPALLLSAWFYHYGSRAALFLLSGTLAFLMYTFIIYTVGVHFNRFFLLYCFTLAFSSYAMIYLLWQTSTEEVKGWFASSKTTLPFLYLLFFALLFYVLWLSDIIPATLNGVVPKSLTESGLLTNPIHVLDLSFLLPGFVVTALILRKKHPLGYLFAPMIMAFSVIMTLSIGTLVVYEYASGFVTNYSVAVVMFFFALMSALLFMRFVRGIDSRKPLTIEFKLNLR